MLMKLTPDLLFGKQLSAGLRFHLTVTIIPCRRLSSLEIVFAAKQNCSNLFKKEYFGSSREYFKKKLSMTDFKSNIVMKIMNFLSCISKEI